MSGGVSLTDIAQDRAIVVCCGSGGVGKTTTAAACRANAARLGRKACVVTIDPARRLANSLGLDALSNRPSQIEGDWPGELYALMLDPKGTVDDRGRRYADTPDQAEGILGNRMYRNITGPPSGTHESIAMEKLHELAEERGLDAVVVDTPPSRHALDFLDAPRRLTSLLNNRFFQVLMMPTRVSLKFVGMAAHALLRTISKVAGADVVRDAVTFFQALEGMEEGFRTRANRVRELLTLPGTAFILVAAPQPDSVDEAVYFAGKLAESDMSVTALIVNRVQPRFIDDNRLEQLTAIAGQATTQGGALQDLINNLAGYTAVSYTHLRAHETRHD